VEHGRQKAAVMADLNSFPFRWPWWLRSPHLQTFAARCLRRPDHPPLLLERWDTPDDDFLRIHRFDGADDKPVALLLHGLEGSAQSNYILGLTKRLSELAWSVVVMEHRSCGGEMNRARRMYHSGETTDLAFVIDTLTQRRPSTPIYIAGFSLGGNQTAKWLGEVGDSAPPSVKAAAVVSPPYDLATSGRRLDRGFHRAYVRHFLRTLIPKAEAKERQYPGCFDIDAVRRSATFEEFDTHATAALHGFRDAADYYEKVSCGQFLPGVRRPTLLLSAADDPFNPGSTLPRVTAAKSPFLYPQFPERGGHVGFIRRERTCRVGYWAEEQIVRFFSACEKMGQ
jgi:predicted alpha/beta-fold hydrolase